ncbi:MAG: SPOR domain-containing protein [Micropepsaceae bacterium]
MASLPVRADGTADADAGVARLEANDPQTAIELFTRAIQSKELSPENLALTYHRRGMAFYMEGEAGRAILDYTIALWHEDLPKDFRPRTLNNRGLAYEAINHYDSALRDYGLSIRLNPNYAEPYANRGNLRRKFNQNAEAVQDYDMALRSGHAHPQFVFAWQGLALEAQGKRREAADAYRRSLQVDSKFELAQSHLTKLDEERALTGLIGRKKLPRGVGGPLIVTGAPGIASSRTESEAVSSGAAWVAPPPLVKSPSIMRVPGSNSAPAPTGPASVPAPSDAGSDVGLRPAFADAPAPKSHTAPSTDPVPPPAPVAIVPPPSPSASKVAPSVSNANGEGGSDAEYALQLGSFASEPLAQAGWSKASNSAKELLQGLTHTVSQVEIPDRGTMFRLFAGVLPDKQSALKLCRTLREKGSACIVIKR